MGNLFACYGFFLGMGRLGSLAIINLICQRAKEVNYDTKRKNRLLSKIRH